jgi:transcriptional regulator GlxA family with amidase domain
VFKKQFGVSPLYYVIQKRVALAGAMLTETDLSMKEVAAAVGYDDPYYFSRIFRKVAGASPTQYRARHRPASGS